MTEREGDSTGRVEGTDDGAAAPVDGRSVDGVDAPHVTRLSYGRHLRVLLVDGDDASSEEFHLAAEEAVLDVHVERATSVDDAMERLAKALGRRRRLPDILVSALEVADSHLLLTALRDDVRFDDLPVLVLSQDPTASLERRSFALGAAGHLRTPRVDYERVALVHTLPDFMPNARAALAQLESRR